MKRKRTRTVAVAAVIEKRGRWYVAYMRGIPGVNTQGRSVSEARRNLADVLRLFRRAGFPLHSAGRAL